MQTIDISQSQEIFTVSRLNREARFILETNLPLLWIEGEMSNFTMPNSGHWYFSIKDSAAQVRCAMFVTHNRRAAFTPKNGMQVLLKARVSLYEGRGEFQLLVEHIEEMGEGRLRQLFEALKKKLAAAGLFDQHTKKPLPDFPKKIGVVTSATGAAIKDILCVLKRRFPCAAVIIYPTLVQGEQAAGNIVKALALANRRNECDVIVLARGGGSLEDLWCFNEEIVAHAVFNSRLVVVSGVGHEIDFTIVDFVADVRAATPSAAAELITPNVNDLFNFLTNASNRLQRCMTQQLSQAQQKLGWADKHLHQQHPKRRLQMQRQQLSLHEAALIRLQNKLLTLQQTRFKSLSYSLLNKTPQTSITRKQQILQLQTTHLKNHLLQILETRKRCLGNLSAKLDGISPLSTLARGYAIASKQGHILQTTKGLTVGQNIEVKLAKGALDCKIEKII